MISVNLVVLRFPGMPYKIIKRALAFLIIWFFDFSCFLVQCERVIVFLYYHLLSTTREKASSAIKNTVSIQNKMVLKVS